MLSTKINFPRKRFLVLVLGPILGVVFNILPMPTVLDFSNHCRNGDICKGFPVVANNQTNILLNYIFWISLSLVFYIFILLTNKLAHSNVYNGRSVLVIAVISVAIGLLLALASNYIPRSTANCGYKCSGFPLISTSQPPPYIYGPTVDDITGEPLYPYYKSSVKPGLRLSNFILNAIFYSFVTFGLVSAASLVIKKRANANPRN